MQSSLLRRPEMFDQLPSGQAMGTVVPVKINQLRTDISTPVNRRVSIRLFNDDRNIAVIEFVYTICCDNFFLTL